MPLYSCLSSRGLRPEGPVATTSNVTHVFGEIIEVLDGNPNQAMSAEAKKWAMMREINLTQAQLDDIVGINIGRFTVVAKANIVDGETIVITNGHPAGVENYTLEFDVAGDGVAGGNTQVDISADTTAEQVRDRLKTAIDGLTLTGATVANVSTDGISITPAAGNKVGVDESVADAGFIASSVDHKKYKIKDSVFGSGAGSVREKLDAFGEAVIGTDNHSDTRGNATLQIANVDVEEAV